MTEVTETLATLLEEHGPGEILDALKEAVDEVGVVECSDEFEIWCSDYVFGLCGYVRADA